MELGSGTEHTVVSGFVLSIAGALTNFDPSYETGEAPTPSQRAFILGGGKTLTVLNESGDIASVFFDTWVSGGFDNNSTPAAVTAALSTWLTNWAADEEALFVLADNAVEIAPEGLQLNDLATGTNEQIRLLATVGTTSTNEHGFDIRGGSNTIIGSLSDDSDNDFESPAQENAINRLRLRTSASGRRIILNRAGSTSLQNLFTSTRSMFLYDGTNFMELPRSTVNGPGSGFMRWDGYLNSNP